MTRNVQIVLVCEDTQHETFARRFLEKKGFSTRRLRVERASGGSAEHFVRNRFPVELEAYRAKRHQVGQALVVFIDGDNKGIAGRLTDLAAACAAKGIEPRQDNERVTVFVPTWNIETWLAYLNGETVDEGKDNYPRLDRPRECRTQVNALDEMCRQEGNLRQPAPASLDAACTEYRTRLG